MDKALNEDYSISKEYESVDFPPHYRRFLVENFLDQEAFVAESLHKIYNSGRVQGTRLLDFGCGPTVHRLASASLHIKDIVLSEWSEPNRKEVEKWLSGDDDALDWSPLLEQCSRVEGFRDINQGVATIEKRIRETVKKVVPCDALTKDILPQGIGEFDVITSNYCLESCCFTIEKFKEAVRKITKYLKKGGTLIMTSVLLSKEFHLHKVIPAFSLTEEMIGEALIDAGLEPRDWFIWKDLAKHESFQYGGLAVYYAVKL